MGIGASIFLIALGAILKFAVVADTAMGLNLDAIGMILIVVGLIGLAVSLLFWSSFSPFGARRRTTYMSGPTADDHVVDAHGHTHVDPHGTHGHVH